MSAWDLRYNTLDPNYSESELAPCAIFISPLMCGPVNALCFRAASDRLANQMSNIESQIQQLPETLSLQLQQLTSKLSLHDIPQPMFSVTDPLGRSIPILLAYCDNFKVSRVLFNQILAYNVVGSRSYPQGHPMQSA
jgi:hypothetical protein